jgi:hypothetical protein
LSKNNLSILKAIEVFLLLHRRLKIVQLLKYVIHLHRLRRSQRCFLVRQRRQRRQQLPNN